MGGECVGLAGLAGSGKEQVADAIAGLLVPSAGGGRRLRRSSSRGRGDVAEARKKGVGYVPRDRHARGIFPQLSVAENLTLTIVERLGRAGLDLAGRERDRQASRMIDALQIVTASTEQPIGELSGGNQQKAVMGRALALEPKVLILVAPTQGVDIASKAALFAIIEKARADGTAVLVVSDDLDELVGLRSRAGHLRRQAHDRFSRAAGQEKDLVAAIEEVQME